MVDDGHSADCQIKLSFADQAGADGAAITAQHTYGGTKPSVYHCQNCGQWHLATAFDNED